jgi:hypothetical protein
MNTYETYLGAKFDQMGLRPIITFASFRALDDLQHLVSREDDYVPTPLEDFIVLFNQLGQTPDDRLFVDLGSGPGMSQLCASFFHIPAVGIERNPDLATANFDVLKRKYEEQFGTSRARSICGNWESDDPDVQEALRKSKYVYAYHWPNDLSSVMRTYVSKCPPDATLILRVQNNMKKQYHDGIESNKLTIGKVIRSPSQNAEFLLCSKPQTPGAT